MKKKYIIFAEEASAITFEVTTDESYIVKVKDRTGEPVELSDYQIVEEFDSRYFEIEPWYWFSGAEVA